MKRLLAKLVSILLIVLAVGIAVISYSFHVEPAWIEVVEIQETLPRLSPDFQGFKIAQISDLHVGRLLGEAQLTSIIDLVNQQKPDLVVITGDFVTLHPERYADTLISGLQRLSAQQKTLSVLGNHDYWSDPIEVRRILQDGNILDLKNSVYTIQRGEGQLQIAGIDDIWSGEPDFEAVLKQLPEEGAAILLVHEPDFADTSSATGRFDLELSGHSHGGQIRLPLIGALWFPPYGRVYPEGRYEVGEMVHYTNRGVGMMRLRARLLCRPEITVFTLQAPA
ncbi:MAG: metallophosphoesterase [Cyanobacteria bacterium P01_D01_bin.73]